MFAAAYSELFRKVRKGPTLRENLLNLPVIKKYENKFGDETWGSKVVCKKMMQNKFQLELQTLLPLFFLSNTATSLAAQTLPACDQCSEQQLKAVGWTVQMLATETILMTT